MISADHLSGYATTSNDKPNKMNKENNSNIKQLLNQLKCPDQSGKINDLNEGLKKIQRHLSTELEGIEEEVERMIITELRAWFETTVAFSSDNDSTELVKNKIKDYRMRSEINPKTVVPNSVKPEIWSNSKRMINDATERELSLCHKRLSELRLETDAAMNRNKEMSQTRIEIEETKAAMYEEHESFKFERLIDLEIPLQMDVERKEKSLFAFKFHHLLERDDQIYTIAINMSTKRCFTDPYCVEVEQLWSSFTDEPIELWNWPLAFYKTRLLLKEEAIRHSKARSVMDPRKRMTRGEFNERPGAVKRPKCPNTSSSLRLDEPASGGIMSQIIRVTSNFMGMG